MKMNPSKPWPLRSVCIWFLAASIQPCTSFSRPSLSLKTRLAGESFQEPGKWAPALVEPQWAEWKASRPRFCSIFPRLCAADGLSVRVTIMAAQDMRESMLGIGSCWFVPFVILCTAFGVLRPGLPAASNSSFHLDKLTAWWHRGPRLSVISLKVYVCMLLLIELLGASSPLVSVLSLPEILRRVRRHPYGPGDEVGLFDGHGLADSPHLMPRLTYLFMPDLDDNTADGYASFHAVFRATLLAAWCIFLVAPCTWRMTSPACYASGAAMYFYFGSLSMMFAPTTSVCSSYFFVVGAVFVVADAEDASAQAWLWKLLVMSILAPYYLAAGFAKLRYAGWIAVLTGSWIREDLLDFPSIFPGFNAWVAHTPLAAALFSFGCMLVEFVGPLLVLSIDAGKPCSKVARWTLTIWSSLVLGFLLGAYVFFGPNFIRQVPLTIMILHGLWRTDGSESQHPEAQGAPPLVYYCRVILAMVLLSSWFAVEMWSDLAHLTGATPQLSKHDPAWPIGEFAMFVYPSDTSSYSRSLSLEILIFPGLCLKKSQDIRSVAKSCEI
ncbi:unnamed protein product [Symbiodinium necroappetens]|uniref:Uncharacterized protein n=1 Tax=Symbiodinium necroappetens TaxID=1628268 RepID=A0A812MN58_9DINO|nr:unnamed protein product [Symbiodinium necroappetens]